MNLDTTSQPQPDRRVVRLNRGESLVRIHPDHYYRQSAIVPYRFGPDGLEILLVTSRSRKRWVIPKGIVELGMTPQDSAAKEAMEEAGVAGPVDPTTIGRFHYPKWGDFCDCEVFAMKVEEVRDTWMEGYRSRHWYPLVEAVSMMKEPAMREILLRMPAILAEHNRCQGNAP